MGVRHGAEHLQEQPHASVDSETPRVAPDVDRLAFNVLKDNVRLSRTDPSIDQVSDVPMGKFRERVGQRVNVLILAKSTKVESVRAASLLQAALAREDDIAGLPHETVVMNFTDAAALGAEAKKRSVSVVYVPPGFDAELESICSAMQPLGVMTITAVPDYVRRCVVVGFEAVSGKPKLLIHLGQARRHGIDFKSEILKLAKVYR